MLKQNKNSGLAKGFTLIELLVVISIIAILLSIIVPSLRRVKELGMRAVCLSNLNQLTKAWQAYATNNKDKIVSGNTWSAAQGNQVVPGEDGWVGWTPGRPVVPFQESSTEASAFGQTIQEQIEEIKAGALFPYVDNYSAFKCRVGRKGNERTYAIVDSMNGWNPNNNNPLVLDKLSKIRNSGGGIVFLDCGEQSYASWSIGMNVNFWTEPAQSRHSTGTTFSFADGHTEHWSWTHPNTILIGKMNIYQFYRRYNAWNYPSIIPGPDPNPDFSRIQAGVWGRSYR